MALFTSSWISPLARLGYAAKGVVYVVVGWLAARVAFSGSGGGEMEGTKGALGWVEGSGGTVLLMVLGVGLAAYSIFRLASAFADTEDEGDDKVGVAKRAGYVVSGFSYGALALAAFTGLAGGGAGDSEGKEALVSKVLGLPGGKWLVVLAGLCIIVMGIFQIVKAVKGSYRENFTLDSYAAGKRRWIERVAKLGLCARGVVFPIMGFFMVKAGIESDADEAMGMGEALEKLAGQSWGVWMLGLTAAGLVCYGIYCWVLMVWGDFAEGCRDK